MELWIGLVELKLLDRQSHGAAGAFANIATWASDPECFRRKAETMAATLDMHVIDVEGAEPIGDPAMPFGSHVEPGITISQHTHPA